MPYQSTFKLPPCPHLPEVHSLLAITHAKAFREECGDVYFLKCLELAHSLWRCESPAQAILQLDKSMMVHLSSAHSANPPIPYQAIIWIIKHAPAKLFIGNPVRHFQHLASRMNHTQPNPDLRIWRAWACMHLTEYHFPELYPRDEKQISKESLIIPSLDQVISQLRILTDNTEIEHMHSLFHPTTP